MNSPVVHHLYCGDTLLALFFDAKICKTMVNMLNSMQEAKGEPGTFKYKKREAMDILADIDRVRGLSPDRN